MAGHIQILSEIPLRMMACCPASLLLFSPFILLSLSPWLSLSSIQRALLAWETYDYIAKASEIDHKQKGNKQSKMNSEHDTHKSSKRIKTFQMSYYFYIQCCNEQHKYGLYFQWCLFFTGFPFLVATGHKCCCCDGRLVFHAIDMGIYQNCICFQILCGFV